MICESETLVLFLNKPEMVVKKNNFLCHVKKSYVVRPHLLTCSMFIVNQNSGSEQPVNAGIESNEMHKQEYLRLLQYIQVQIFSWIAFLQWYKVPSEENEFSGMHELKNLYQSTMYNV